MRSATSSGGEIAVDGLQRPTLPVEIQDRCRRACIDGQAPARRQVIVIGSQDERASARTRGGAGFGRVLVDAASLADAALAQAAEEFDFGNGDFDDDQRTAPFEKQVEHLGLLHGSRKAVEHESIQRVRLTEALIHERGHDVVGDELAGGHGAADGDAQEIGRCRRTAENVAGRDFRHPPCQGDAIGLRAFTGPGRADEYEIQRIRPGTYFSSFRTIAAPSASAFSFIFATMRASGFMPQSVLSVTFSAGTCATTFRMRLAICLGRLDRVRCGRRERRPARRCSSAGS